MPLFQNSWQNMLEGNPNQLTRVNPPAGGKLMSFVKGFELPIPGVTSDWGDLLLGHTDVTMPGITVTFEDLDTTDNVSNVAQAYETRRVTTSRNVILNSRATDRVHAALMNSIPDQRFEFRHVMPFPYCDLVHSIEKLAGVTGSTLTRSGGRTDTVALRAAVPAVSIPGAVYFHNTGTVGEIDDTNGALCRRQPGTTLLRVGEAALPSSISVRAVGNNLSVHQLGPGGAPRIPFVDDDARRLMIFAPGLGYTMSTRRVASGTSNEDQLSTMIFPDEEDLVAGLKARNYPLFLIIWDFPSDRQAV